MEHCSKQTGTHLGCLGILLLWLPKTLNLLSHLVVLSIRQNFWQQAHQSLCALFFLIAPALDPPEALLHRKPEGVTKSQFILMTHILTLTKQVLS